MKHAFYLNRVATALALLAMLACGSAGDESAKRPASEPDELATTDLAVTETPENMESAVPEPQEIAVDTPATTTPEPPPPKPKPKPKPKVAVQKKPDPPAPPPQPAMVTIPAATTIGVTLDRTLRTDSSQVDDQFTATSTAEIMIDGEIAIPAGATLRGRLTAVEEPHRTSGRGSMTLQFEEFVAGDGKVYAISIQPITVEAEPDKVSDKKKIAIGSVVGGLLGALGSKKKVKGAATGAALGAAAAGALALATKGKQLELTQGYEFTLEIVEPVAVPVAKDGSGD